MVATRIEEAFPFHPPKCGLIPEKLSDLDGKLSLSVHGTDGVTYVGTKPKLECVFDENGSSITSGLWQLTITLSSNGKLKILKDSEIVSITRNI